MSLNELVEEHNKAHDKLESIWEEKRKYEELTSNLHKEINNVVNQDFSDYLSETFSDLSEDEKITGWRIFWHTRKSGRYNIGIAIEYIGGKELRAEDWPKEEWDKILESDEASLPNHLQKVHDFGKGYPIPVRVFAYPNVHELVYG